MSGLQHDGVHERLGQVPAQLALDHVELLGEQGGWAARGTVPLEPTHRLGQLTLLMQCEGHLEPRQKERALGPLERPVVVTKSVEVVLLRQITRNGRECPPSSRVLCGQGPTHRRHQQGGVGPVIVGGTLPST